MTYTRRDFGRIALAAVPLMRTAGGITIGVQTYSYRALPAVGPDQSQSIIQALKTDDAGEVELFSPGIEPTPGPAFNRDALRQWRLTTPMDFFSGVAKRFQDAGVKIHSYTMNYNKGFTDEEIDKTFQQGKALGTNIVATSTQVSMAPRLLPYAEKHKMLLAFHGHSNTRDANEFATPESFENALKQSKYARINLDIGHFFAAGYDPVAFIEKHHASITHLHIKDRKKNDGPNMPWGEGDTPIKPVLLLLKQKRYPIPAFVEYEYRGTGTPVEEVKKCLDYMRTALA